MKVEIIRNTVASGKPVFIGETIELSQNEAKLLIRLNKAAPAKTITDKSQPIEKAASSEVEKPSEEVKPKKTARSPRKTKSKK